MKNASVLAQALVDKGYGIVSGGTDNHCFLVDLRNKNITGKDAENALVASDITVNKNMVPYDDKSPFVTSGIRIGTPAMTTRGLKESHMLMVADLIDEVLMGKDNPTVIASVKKKVNEMMEGFGLFEG
jgi:glycine hydroxymethyltransferase